MKLKNSSPPRTRASVDGEAVDAAGIRVANLGNSSVRYEVGLFNGQSDGASAEGHFIHVYVTRHDQRPANRPEPMRTALARIGA